MFTEKINSLWFFLVVLLPQSISLGRCHHVTSSVCWMSRTEAPDRQDGNLWLNDVALGSVGEVGRLASLTLYPGVEHRLTLRHGGLAQTWTLTITPRTKTIKIRGRQRPSKLQTNSTKDLLNLLHPSDVFACENGTLFFHQDENLLLATGHTGRLPVQLASRGTSMLLVSWRETLPAPTVSLYGEELGSYNVLSVDGAPRSHYRFTALEPCTPYVACVQAAGSRSVSCLSAMTDPDVPQDLRVSTWNSSSLSLAWRCPDNGKYSLFLVTAFYLNATGHVVREEAVRHEGGGLAFTLSDLRPCTRVRLGLQTVCLAGLESRHSRMVHTDGSSGHGAIGALRLVSSGPDRYVLRWEVSDAASVSSFRVYHDGVLQGTTLAAGYTVGGLQPCHRYRAKVEALCGEGVLLSSRTVAAHTGPRGVSGLRFRSNDSTALWLPGTTEHPAVAFLYELTLGGGVVRSGRSTEAELRLPGLEEGQTYVLDVWEECDARWESQRSSLIIEATHASPRPAVRAVGPPQILGPDFSSMGLSLMLPWSLPDNLRDDATELRVKVEKLFKQKLQELLKANVEVVAIVPASDSAHTEVLFMTFNASTEADVPVSVRDQLDHVRSLNMTDVTVGDGIIVWNGPDPCAPPGRPSCPARSVCVATPGSYSCACRRGFYDVSSVLEAARPVCNEKGLFSRCAETTMSGGIARPYLTSHLGGTVDVTLNDGRCSVRQRDDVYYFQTSRRTCGTERQVNHTHIVFQNTLIVTRAEEPPISRRSLKVVWRCAHPRLHVRRAQVDVERKWFANLSLVELSSSLQQAVAMTLYGDESYAWQRGGGDSVHLGLEDTLFFQVALRTNGSLASDVLLRVESCWATESPDPQQAVRGVFLQDGCPADDTFRWLSVNGLAPSSRFSIQMFTMPKGLPLYFHCLTNICGPEENCTKPCASEQRTKRTAHVEKRVALVSVGPLVVDAGVKSRDVATSWTEKMTVILVVAGSVGILGITLLSISAAKAIATYYERVQQ